jgi:predicted nuclease of restriction endonuclease-like (RecB) superfamily
MKNMLPTIEYFLTDIRNILVDARKQAYASVNTIMVQAYWKIGQRIVEEEQAGKDRADYGHYLIRNLAKQLGDEFGKGFSVANLRNCRQFFLVFPEFEKRYAVRSELSWTHYRLIMRVENPQAREYYLREATAHQWSSRQLERNLASHYYERLLVAPTSQDQPESLPDRLSTGEFIKDPYVLEFLDLPEAGVYHESTLEAAIITKLQPFLLELGKGFSFVGRQFRISTETSHFYIDLVFYNYLLKCFVLIDLKTTKLKHQDIGQMDMYVRMFDDLKRGADDNPTLGIILCADKDDTVVRYSVLNDSQQIFASKYLHILPSEEELRQALEARHVLQITSDDEGGIA